MTVAVNECLLEKKLFASFEKQKQKKKYKKLKH